MKHIFFQIIIIKDDFLPQVKNPKFTREFNLNQNRYFIFEPMNKINFSLEEI